MKDRMPICNNSCELCHCIVKKTYLLLAARHNSVLGIFGICLHLNALLTARRRHSEGPDLGAVIVANRLLFSVEANSLAYEVAAALTPNIERHFEPVAQQILASVSQWRCTCCQEQTTRLCCHRAIPDHQDALVDLFGPFPQGVLALLFVEATLFGVPFWREVKVVSPGCSQGAHGALLSLSHLLRELEYFWAAAVPYKCFCERERSCSGCQGSASDVVFRLRLS